MRIGLVGGGTGGHFYPLIAVAEVLATYEYRPELYYFGPAPYDQQQLEKYHISFQYCPAGKLRRYFSFQNVLDIFRTFFGVWIALWKLYVLYPDVIFSKGGYTSVPVLMAARFLRIPVVIHESDAVAGRANILARSFAQYIAIAYPEAAAFFPPERTARIGIPLRQAMTAADPDPFTTLGIPADKPLIYVTGGSSGAERINNVILRTLKDLLPNYRIFHQTGVAHYQELQLTAQALLTDTNLQSHYYIADTIPAETVNALFSAASLVVTRAGSTTLFEIAHFHKPSIVIPIPEDVSRDQRTNAYAYARSGAAVVIEEHNLTEHLLIKEIQSIIDNPTTRARMQDAAATWNMPEAAAKVAGILIQIGIEHGS